MAPVRTACLPRPATFDPYLEDEDGEVHLDVVVGRLTHELVKLAVEVGADRHVGEHPMQLAREVVAARLLQPGFILY